MDDSTYKRRAGVSQRCHCATDIQRSTSPLRSLSPRHALRPRPPRQGVDFRDGEAVLERCREWTTLGFPGAYGGLGVDAYPLELVFFKTNRGVQEEALAVHTRAALANAPWAVPAALLCGA
jgi:hypothetical protein